MAKKTPAQQTWTPGNLQGLANAYSALNPTWTPPAADNAALPNPISPVSFDPNGDPSYAAGVAAAKSADEHAQANYDYQTHNIAQTYGYDANGNLITSGADLNPYAQAAILKRNFDNTVRGTTNSYAAQGQLYSGAIQNASNANNYNYGQSSDALQRAARNAYQSNTASLNSANDAYASAQASLVGPAYSNFIAGQRGS